MKTLSHIHNAVSGFETMFCPLIDFIPSACVVSFDKRLEIYEKELVFHLAAALDPRWKLAWCTHEEAKCVNKEFAKKKRYFNSNDAIRRISRILSSKYTITLFQLHVTYTISNMHLERYPEEVSTCKFLPQVHL